MARPKQNNNPFAIIQPKPSKWKGLAGMKPDGFLIFDSPTNGVRAGFINLVNTYIKRGLNTIEKIFPVYAPAGHGANVPEDYINRVVKLTGIPRNKVISTPDELYKVGKAIVTHEEGNFWVTLQEFNNGFKMAEDTTNLNKVFSIGTGAVIILLLCLVILL